MKERKRLKKTSVDEDPPPDTLMRCKDRLRNYTENASIPLPVYQTFTEEDNCLPCHRSQVWVDGECFLSPNRYQRKKFAEEDAARHALIGLCGKMKIEEHLVTREDTVFCKKIVNEFALKMNMKPPTYATNETETVMHRFVSSLQLNDVTYVGQACKNEKKAEQSAARAAILSILGSGFMMTEIVRSKSKLYDALLKVKESPIIQGGGNKTPDAVNQSMEDNKNMAVAAKGNPPSPHAIAPPPASSVMMVPGIEIVPPSSDQAPATEKKKRWRKKQKNGVLVNPSMGDKENEVVEVKGPPAEIPHPSSLVSFPTIVQHVLPEPNTTVAAKSLPAEIPQPSSLVPFPDNVQHVQLEPNTEAPCGSVHIFKEQKLLQALSSPSPHAIAPPSASSVMMVPGNEIVPPSSDQAPATRRKKCKKKKRKNGVLVNPSMEDKENEVVAVRVRPADIPQPSSLVPFSAIVQHVLPEPNTVVDVKSSAEIPQPSSLIPFLDIVQHVLPEHNNEAGRESAHVFKDQQLLQSPPSQQAIAPQASSMTMFPGIEIVPSALDQASVTGKKDREIVNPSMGDKENEVVEVKGPPAEIPHPSSLVSFPAIVQHVLPEPNTTVAAKSLPAEIPQPNSLVPFPDNVQHVQLEPNTEAPRGSVDIFKEQKLLQALSLPSPHAIAPPSASSVMMVPGNEIVPPSSDQAPATRRKKCKKKKRKNGVLVNPSMEDKENKVVAVRVRPADIPQPSSLVPFSAIVQHVLPEPNTVVDVKSSAEIPQPSSLIPFLGIVQHVLPEHINEAGRESEHVFKDQQLLQSSPSQQAIAPQASSMTMFPGIEIVPSALDQASVTGKKDREIVNPSMGDKENEVVEVKGPPADIPHPSSLVSFPAIVQHVLPEPNTTVAAKSLPADIPQPSSLFPFPDNVQHVQPEPNTEAPRGSVHIFKEQKLLLALSSPSPHAIAPPLASSVMMVPGIEIVPPSDQAPATGKNKCKKKRKNGVLVNPSMENKEKEFVAVKVPPADIPQLSSLVPGIENVPPSSDQAPATRKKKWKKKRKNGLLVNPSMEDKENEVVAVKVPPADIPQLSSLVPFSANVQHVLPEPNTIVDVKSSAEIPQPSSLIPFLDIVQHVLPEHNNEARRESVHVFKDQQFLQSSPSQQAIAPHASPMTMFPGIEIVPSALDQATGKKDREIVNPSIEDKQNEFVEVKVPPAEIPHPSSLVPFPAIVQHVLSEPNTTEIPPPSSLFPFPDNVQHVQQEPNTEAPRGSVHIFEEHKLLQALPSPSPQAIVPHPALSMTMVPGIEIDQPASDQAPVTGKKKRKRNQKNGVILNPSMEDMENEVVPVKVPPADIPQPISLAPFPAIVQHVLQEHNTVVDLKSPTEIQQPSSLVPFPDNVQHVLPEHNTEASCESVHLFNEQQLLQASLSPALSVMMVPGIEIVPPASDQALATGKKKHRKRKTKNDPLVNPTMEDKANEAVAVNDPPAEIPQPNPFPAVVQHALPELNTEALLESVHILKKQKLLQASSTPSPQAVAPPALSVTSIEIVPSASE